MIGEGGTRRRTALSRRAAPTCAEVVQVGLITASGAVLRYRVMTDATRYTELSELGAVGVPPSPPFPPQYLPL